MRYQDDQTNIVKETVLPVRIDMKCFECKTGRMRPNNFVYDSMPPQYPHTCNNKECGASDIFLQTYPYMTYEDSTVVQSVNGHVGHVVVDTQDSIHTKSHGVKFK